MIPRDSKYGRFWGCKNFPQCKGTRDSEGRSKNDRQREREEEESDKELMKDGGLLDSRPTGFRCWVV